MAHVLLPCDVPTWPEVERHLSQLRFAHSPEQLVADMQRIYDLCCVGLDPEDPPREEIRLDLLKRFLKSLSAEESRRFFESTLPSLISCAIRLRELRPSGGFLYCLQQQDGMFALSRPFVASLLANSFFSTFPKRTSRTHPTLLDFNCSELFPFLDTPCHCEKLRSLFAYFDCTFQDEPDGTVYFCRQVTAPKNQMSLPEWMCSDCPLCPLMVRTRGLIEDAEPVLLKCYPSSANVGNEFLGRNCTMECSVFLSCPEVLTALLFVELLGDNEALTVDGLLPLDPRPRVNGEPVFGPSECSVCLLDIKDHSSRPVAQFEDASLLRELNKCLVAFRQALTQRRPSPVGQSSSSSAAGHDPPYFHSLSSSKTSSSRSSVHATDSPPDNLQGLHGHEPFVDCKHVVADRLETTTAVVSGKKGDSPDPGKRGPQSESKVPTLAGVLGALKKKAEAQVAKPELPVPPPRSPRRVFKVLSSRSPSPTSPKPDGIRVQPAAEANSEASIMPPSLLNSAVNPASNIARPLATKPPPPTSRRSLRSLGSSGSKGSVERNKSLEDILSRISVSQPSTPSSSSSAPLLTQAVLCAQRHPSPRPDRRGSGSQAAMVFRPVNLSPLMSRRSAFRPATECLLDQRRQSGGGAPPIALPHCEFSALSKIKPACVKVVPVKVLTSPPVSSPRVQLSIESAPEDGVWRRQESVELESPGVEISPSLLRSAHAATTVKDTDVWTLARQQQPVAEEGAPARGHRRTASGSSTTPFEYPTTNPSLLRVPSQKSCDDDYHTADESLEDSPEGHGAGLPGEVRPRCLKSRRERSLRSHTSGGGGGSSAFSSVSQRLSRDDSASSAGFVLDYRSDDDDYITSALSKHERYEDFRRRIRRRGRRLARRLSRSLRASYSSGSSDMDDIDEDPELGFSRSQPPVCSLRAANSEPTLHVLLPTKGSARELPALSIASELVMTSSPGRRQTLVMTTGQGMPKAYSFDGVNPNLPVPFKAKFRCKKTPADVSHACAVGLTRQDTEFIKAHSFRPVSPDLSAGTSEEGDNADSAPGEQEEEEPQDFDTASGDSEDRRRESFVSVEEGPPQESEEPHPPPSSFPMRLSASGLRPVATCRWARDCVDPSGDAQLEALVQWIAASVAGVPGLVIYTGGQPSLEQLSQVSFKVEERRWTVGDLACETLRFCRNRVAVHEGRNRSSIHPGTTLFSQLLGQSATATAPNQANAAKSGFRASETCGGDGGVRGVFQTHDSLE